MILRHGKKIGTFYGCVKYPICYGKRNSDGSILEFSNDYLPYHLSEESQAIHNDARYLMGSASEAAYIAERWAKWEND